MKFKDFLNEAKVIGKFKSFIKDISDYDEIKKCIIEGNIKKLSSEILTLYNQQYAKEDSKLAMTSQEADSIAKSLINK